MRLPSSSQADPSRLRIANVDSLDCRRPAKLLRRLRYDETRDNEGKVSMVDSSAAELFSPLFLSLHLALPFPSCSAFSPVLGFPFQLSPYVLCTRLHRAHILIHSSSNISSPSLRFHANSARLLFFNSRSLTRRRYGFAAIPIIRCTHTTTPSIMAMTATPPSLSLCHPISQPPSRPCSLCLFAVRCRSLGRSFLPFSSLSVSFVLSRRRSVTKQRSIRQKNVRSYAL